MGDIPVPAPLLHAVLQRVHPGADAMPDAATAAVAAELERHAGATHARFWPAIAAGIGALGPDFASVSADEQDDRLRTVEREGWFAALVRLASEAYYGQRGSPSWTGLGYVEGPSRDPGAPIVFPMPATTPFADIGDTYDVVVVGSGAGGGVATWVLSRAGLRVLTVERGSLLPYDSDVDHVRNHRLLQHGHNTGPDPEPRVFEGRVIKRPWDGGWHNNAMTVGGGTRVYQGMAWRMHPDDFRLASLHGVPDGSSLADWPITYDELEPFYDRAEWTLGVCGDGASHRVQGQRTRGYPMPPFTRSREGERLQQGADALGWSTGPVPLLINSVPRGGRAACVGCGHCVGFPCPSDAKNGTFNALLPDAVTGTASLATGVRCERVMTTRDAVVGVRLRDLATGGVREVHAGHVVVAAGAIESARLLLASALGSAHVGRHLQGHLYPSVFAQFDEPVVDMVGPGLNLATTEHYYGPDGLLGGVLHDDVIKWPILHWYWAQAPDAPRWGRAALESMRDGYLRTSHLFGPVQEVPNSASRVTLAEGVDDAHGNAVAHLRGALHPETVRAAHWLQDRAVEWFEAAKVTRLWRARIGSAMTAGQHQAGTCRMGDDPAASVTDRWGRVHGHRNLWVMDGGVHVNNGGCNPVLTILALAYRAAEHLTRQ